MILSNKPRYKVRVYVNGKLGTTVKVTDNEVLEEMIPDLVKKVTRKGLGRLLHRVIGANGRVEELHIENTKKGTARSPRVIGFLRAPLVHAPRCPQNSP